MTIRVVLVDDHAMFREALHVMLKSLADVEVVGEASNGSEVNEVIKRVQPDIIIMDVSMPGLNGIEATRSILSSCSHARVVALSAFVYKQFVRQMLDAGAHAYVAKASASTELLNAIRFAAAGKTYLCPDAKAALAETGWRGSRGKSIGDGVKAVLTPREIEVLRLLATGKTSPEIAQTLKISVGTVDVHRRNIMNKLDMHTVAELTTYAVRLGMLAL